MREKMTLLLAAGNPKFLKVWKEAAKCRGLEAGTGKSRKMLRKFRIMRHPKISIKSVNQ
jgi:hypothetical protein